MLRPLWRTYSKSSLNQLKRGRRQQPLDDREIAARGNPEGEAQAGDLSREIQAILMELSEDYRTVIILRHFSDCSYQQIGEILQIPEKTVKSRLYSARQLMKGKLQAAGLH